MKKIFLYTAILLLSFQTYSQNKEGNVWREAARYLYENGFDRNNLRNTIELVREMSSEISKNKKISKKTEKKLNKMSFSDNEVDILKSLSQKMSKMVVKVKDKEKEKKLKKETTDFGNENRERMNRARADFSSGQRGGNLRVQSGNISDQRYESNNRQGPPRPEATSPIFEKLIQYIREQGVNRDNIRSVMTIVREIGREYRSLEDKSGYKPSEEKLKTLAEAGLSDETASVVIEIIKALVVYDR